MIIYLVLTGGIYLTFDELNYNPLNPHHCCNSNKINEGANIGMRGRVSAEELGRRRGMRKRTIMDCERKINSPPAR